MNVLFIGGTGNISTACTTLALDRGIEVVHLNRGNRDAPDDVETIVCDIRDSAEASKAIAGRRFDCVVDWIGFTPEHVRLDIELFQNRTDQFVFISSASVYQKPPNSYLITESTPAHNPFWTYSQNKIACEEVLLHEYRTDGFPMTIVRPSHTYSDGWVPTVFESTDFTIIQRMLDSRPVVVHGDGQSLWTITHSEDFAKGFVGLIGHPGAIGETLHITGDEALTWDQIHQAIARAFGVEARIVHLASDMIARLAPEYGPGLLGDKQYSMLFDNSRIRRLVPSFQSTIRFHEGMRRSAEWLARHPEKKVVNADLDKLMDDLVAASDPQVR